MARLTRGERFKDARQIYNQHGKQIMDEVAAATGISKSLISYLESDQTNRTPAYDKIVTLAKHYGVTTDFLLELTDDPLPQKSAVDELGLSPQVVELLRAWNATTENKNSDYYTHKAIDTINRLFELGLSNFLSELTLRVIEFQQLAKDTPTVQDVIQGSLLAKVGYLSQHRIPGTAVLTQRDFYEFSITQLEHTFGLLLRQLIEPPKMPSIDEVDTKTGKFITEE